MLCVTGVAVPDDALRRMRDAGISVTTDGDSPWRTSGTTFDIQVVSTRTPTEAFAALGASSLDTVVIAHAGAERIAAQLVAAGAATIVGEGNEAALQGLANDQHAASSLLTSFERRFGLERRAAGQGIDFTTGVPDIRSFERRLATFVDAERLPVLAYVTVLSERWRASTPDVAVMVQRRRLATSLSHVCAAARAELYSLGAGEFAVVGEHLDESATEALGSRLVTAAGTFHDRGLPLRLVVGYAGPQSATSVEQLVEGARRAVEIAGGDASRSVLGAAELTQGLSVTTELEAVIRLVADAEQRVPEGVGHGERVGRLTAELARLCGVTPGSVSRLQLAGHVHDVGQAALPADVNESDGVDDHGLQQFRSFPMRSSKLLELIAGHYVADVLRAQREHWDGTGYPSRLSGNDIPEGARVLAVAHAIDRHAYLYDSSPAAIAADLTAQAGRQLDPAIVAVAQSHLPSLLAVRH